MGLQDKMKKIGTNVLTFGASNRIEKATNHYSSLLDELTYINEEYERRRGEINKILEEVIAEKQTIIELLKEMQKITRSLTLKERDFVSTSIKRENYNLEQIEKSISIGEAVFNVTKGISAGIGTAAGTWALIGTFGTASTGTAIGSLSGVAASNAILAWLGGGSLAVGGGGMALGTVVLGGIVAVPALLVTGLIQHISASKKIAEIKEAELKAIQCIDDIKKSLFTFDLVEQRSKELIGSLKKAGEAFAHELKITKKVLYPLGVISKVLKKIKKVIFKSYYSDKDVVQISKLGEIARSVVKIMDTPIIELNESN